MLHAGPILKISRKSVEAFFRNVAYRQTNRQTNIDENITFDVRRRYLWLCEWHLHAYSNFGANQQELTTQTKPILRRYSLFKNDFFIEHHLESITDFRYRTAITKLRCSSHALEIERGRYQNPKVPRDLRLCPVCQVVEDEEHFVTNCSINQAERRLLCSKKSCKVPRFSTLSDFDKFLYLLTNNDPQILTWFGKFVHQSFIARNKIFLLQVTVAGISTLWRCPPFWSILLVDRFNAFILFYVLCNTALFYCDSLIQLYVNCSIFYILYILSTEYICDFMHMYFVRNDEIKMFNHIADTH